MRFEFKCMSFTIYALAPFILKKGAYYINRHYSSPPYFAIYSPYDKPICVQILATSSMLLTGLPVLGFAMPFIFPAALNRQSSQQYLTPFKASNVLPHQPHCIVYLWVWLYTLLFARANVVRHSLLQNWAAFWSVVNVFPQCLQFFVTTASPLIVLFR